MFPDNGKVWFPNEGNWVGTPREIMKPDIKIEVCPECEKEWNGRYRATMKVYVDEFIESARRMNASIIEQHRKNNAVYKEKQDEIDRLRRKIDELEMERSSICLKCRRKKSE